MLSEERQNKPYNKIRYVENYSNPEMNNQKEIIHVIIAKYGTEAGDYYNDSTIDYIKKIGDTIFDGEELDIIDKLKEYFCEVSGKILKFESPDEVIKKGDIILNDDNTKLILNYKKKLELETFYGDFLSFTFGEPKFTPEYYIVSSDPEYVILYLDGPGKTKIDEVSVSFLSGSTTVNIRGKREKTPYKTMGRNFGSGNFDLKIVLEGENGDIKKNNVEIEPPINGFHRIKFKRQNNKN